MPLPAAPQALTAPIPTDKIRILVVGESGVGKTSLVHHMVHGKPLRGAVWTVGCNVEVMIHRHAGRNYFVELFDVGGSMKLEPTRSIFYGNVHGIILVHDLSNRKSYANLRNWIKEIYHSAEYRQGPGRIPPPPGGGEFVFDDRRYAFPFPFLIVGNKLDADRLRSNNDVRKPFSEISSTGIDHMDVSAITPHTLAPGSGNADKLDGFFGRVVDCLAQTSSGGGSGSSLPGAGIGGASSTGKRDSGRHKAIAIDMSAAPVVERRTSFRSATTPELSGV